MDLGLNRSPWAEDDDEPENDNGKPFDPIPYCTPKQQEALLDPAKRKIWVAGRGGGKSRAIVYALLQAATDTPGCAVIYINTTINRAVKTIWRDLKEQNEFHELGGEPKEKQSPELHMPNGSVIYVSGADSEKHLDRWQGIPKIRLVALDELNAWDPFLVRHAVSIVFIPRLNDPGIDGKGQIILAGTGSKDSGYYYEAFSNPALGYSAKRWLYNENPLKSDPEGDLKEACQARGVDETDPMIRRQYFAEFNSGGVAQIFHLAPANDNGRSPTLVSRDDLPKRNDLDIVIGADFGTIDAAACAVWVATPADPHLYLAEVTKEHGLSGSEQVKFVRSVAARWEDRGTVEIRGDGGGLGKALVMDLQATEDAWEVEPAEKTQKVSNIRLMAGDLRNGTIKICEGEKEFIKTLSDPEWHPDHIGERIRGHMPDEIDAAYMGYRRLKEIHRYSPPPPPEDPEEALERKIREGIARSRQLYDNPYGD